MALFTAETAVIAAKKSHAPDSARYQKPDPPQTERSGSQTAEPLPELAIYTRARLERVRTQLDRVDAMMLTEDDPAKLDRLASAQARLSEQERILAGRPLPGSFRPQADKASRRQGRPVEVWSDETPQQVVSSVPAPNPITPTSTPDDVSH